MTFTDALLKELAAAQGDTLAQTAVAVKFVILSRPEGERAKLQEAFDSAAVLRWFDTTLIGWMLEIPVAEADARIEALKTLPFVERLGSSQPERWNIHETSRLGWRIHMARDQPDHFRALSARAAHRFVNDSSASARIEWIYHWVCAAPEQGARELKELARDWAIRARPEDRYALVAALRDLEETTLAGFAARVAATRLAAAITPRPATLSKRAPLSFAQARLWFLDQLDPGQPRYNVSVAVTLSGLLDVGALAGALGEIMARHEALRTRYESSDGIPVQVIDAAVWLTLPIVDLSELGGERKEDLARQLLLAEAMRGFNLAAGPILRALLLRRGPELHDLALTIHHIASDVWSTKVLFDELSLLYESALFDRPSPLAPLPLQYADWVVWQREWLESEELETQLDWWRTILLNVLPLVLPTDRPRPPLQSFRGAELTFPLSSTLTSLIEALRRRYGVTPFMVFLAAFQALAARLAQQERFAVGTPINGRSRAEMEGLIGNFVNALAIPAWVGKNERFVELLTRTRETTLGALAHQDLPFERLVEAFDLERDLSREPIFQTMLSLQDVPPAALSLPGLTASSIQAPLPIAKYDLTLTLAMGAGDSIGLINYAVELFDAATVERLALRFVSVLEQIAASPEVLVGDLNLLSEAERNEILFSWNDTTVAYPREQWLAELFALRAAASPDAIALVWPEDSGVDLHLTFRELKRRACGIAHSLRARGVAPGTAVGLYLERSPLLVAAILGAVSAGAAYVPIDYSSPITRLMFMVQDSGMALLITTRSGAEVLPEMSLPVLLLDRYPVSPREALPVLPELGGDALAYVMYTSGSTGRPKGVAVPQRGVTRLIVGSDYLRLSAADRIGHGSNPAFDAATFEIWGAMLSGATLVGIPRNVLMAPGRLVAFLIEKAVTVQWLTTSLFNLVVSEQPAGLAGLAAVLFGGEGANAQRVREILAAGSPTRLLNMYGPTESTTFSTWQVASHLPLSSGTVPIGRPIANSRVHVLDRWLQPVPVGVAGELAIAGDGLAWGYVGWPGLTSERFVPDPWTPVDQPGGRLYRTGDKVLRRANGDIEFIGRFDSQVKMRGFRIELGEIEAVLNEIPSVRAVAVIAVGEEPGQGRLIAYLEPATGEVLPNDEVLRTFLRARIPEYMVPSRFVALDALPITANGKLDRRALPGITPRAGVPRVTGTPPRDSIEDLVAEVWREVLHIDAITIEQDFFDLGGDSLSAVRMYAQLHQRLGISLPLLTLFEAPTLADFADRVREVQVGELANTGEIASNRDA